VIPEIRARFVILILLEILGQTNIVTSFPHRRRALKLEFRGNFDVESRNLLAKEINSHLEESKLVELQLCIYFNFPEGLDLNESKINVLLLQEPQSVLPWQYRSKTLSRFDLVIAFGPWRAKNLGIANWVFMPYKFKQLEISQSVKRSIYISMINAAKFSSGSSSNYGLRRKIAKRLSKEDVDFRIFGWDWNSGKLDELRRRAVALRASFRAGEKVSWGETFSTLLHRFNAYHGGIADKLEILAQSELSLIIENDSDYVTEKIFDAFSTLTVPVFVGPSFAEFLPEMEACIFRCDRDVESIVQRVKEITLNQVAIKRNAILELTRSGVLIEKFEFEKVWTDISQIIVNFVRKQF
jgi:hypothetical protein